MRMHVTTSLIAGAIAIGSVVSAQDSRSPSPQPQSPRTTQAQPPASRGSEGLVTLEGCLVRESDIAGRIPKIPGSAGVTGDYVLTRAKVLKGTAPASLTGMYDIDDIDAGLLASSVNQRVQIDGWFAEIDRATNPAGRSAEDDDLIAIKGHAVRAIAKDCQH